MNVKSELTRLVGDGADVQLNDVDVRPDDVKAILINEVVPADPAQDFYGSPDAEYLKTALPLLREAGADIGSIYDALDRGIYVTNAVKTPKVGYAVEKGALEDSLPYLEAELALFPNVKVVMLMGDVAKKSFNMIVKKATGRNAVPAGSTYKLRAGEFFHEGARVMPSYILTGGNLAIERSKSTMIVEDLAAMLALI